MKRIKIRFDDIVSLKALVKAFYDCKSKKKNRRDVRDFEARLGYEISKLYKELKNNEYKPSVYCEFKICEQKERTILQPKLRDLVVQRLIYNAIYDEVDKKIYYHAYGVRKSRGLHKASRLAQRYMGDGYYLQMDIRKYFFNIKENILKRVLDRYFKD